MMKRVLVFLAAIVIVNLSSAQEYPSEMVHDGKVVLLSEEVIEGKIKYDLENDIIQVVVNGSVQTYSARKILYFTIYDESVEMFRTFYAIPYEVQPNYEVPILFEVLYEGSLSLLAREQIVTETVPQYSSSYRSTINMTRTRLSYEYFFLDKNGNFTKYNMKKFELYEVMRKKESQIKQYIKKNNLKHDSRRDLVRIIAYYNALIQ